VSARASAHLDAYVDARPSTGGVNFTQHMRALCADIARRLPELAHVDMRRVAIRFCQARRQTRYGLHASLTPMRFEGGRLTARRRGRTLAVERLFDDAGQEMLYLLSFYLPRFLDRPLDEKLSTVVHELWHIGPAFDGDLRRHPGRCYAHTSSQKQYDALVDALAGRWLALGPPAEVYEFLRYDFRELTERHGPVYGQRIRTPRLIRQQR
jgi:predicted metallopeptidase